MAFAFTTTEWVILGLVLVFGWLLGLLSSSAGKKWKARYEEERANHAATRAAHAEALQAEQNRLREYETRNRDLEAKLRDAEHTRSASTAATIAPATAVTSGTTAAYAQSTDTTSYRPDDDGADDLALIRGIGPDGRERVAADGIRSYRDLETMDRDHEQELERRHGLEAGTIEREGWREQARLLREGKRDEHRRRFVD